MSKVCQHLLSLSAALSLAGLFASVMLWVHSYSWDGFHSYRIKEGMATRSICLFVSPGQVAVASGVTLMPAPLGLEYKKFSQATFDRTVERHQYSLFGFRVSTFAGVYWMDCWDCEIPVWFLSLLSCAAPAVWFYRRRYRFFAPGCCMKCGYDLRATPWRCPECGAVPKSVNESLEETRAH